MCLAVPMRVIELRGMLARCEARGVQREASLMLLGDEPLAVGDMVLIHLGHIVSKVAAEEAAAAWALYDEMLGAAPPPGGG